MYQVISCENQSFSPADTVNFIVRKTLKKIHVRTDFEYVNARPHARKTFGKCYFCFMPSFCLTCFRVDFH